MLTGKAALALEEKRQELNQSQQRIEKLERRIRQKEEVLVDQITLRNELGESSTIAGLSPETERSLFFDFIAVIRIHNCNAAVCRGKGGEPKVSVRSCALSPS